MEQRNGNMIISKAGGNASKNAYNCKVSIPKKWADEMGIDMQNRGVVLAFDGQQITIKKQGGDPDEK